MTNNKTKRIGLLTFHFSDNFGAVLQAYALKKWFEQQGCVAEFVNYHPRHVEEGGPLRKVLSPREAKANLKRLYLRATHLRTRWFGNSEQARKFATFRQEQLGVAGPSLRQSVDISSVASRFDLIVAGSDQIWGYSLQQGFDPAYFLAGGVPMDVRKVSYAASFGRDSFGNNQMEELARLLPSLDAISVRERSGVDIVRVAAGREAACVPDPVLLHSDYADLVRASMIEESGHVFCYALRSATGVREVAGAVAADLGCEVLSPYNVHRRWPEIGRTIFPGPADWVKLIQRAAFVVTNSFHGAVFSVLLHKPFIVVGLPAAKASLNARSQNLLLELGLQSRFLPADQRDHAGALMREAIDWNAVDARVEAYRQRGHDYLLRQLAEVYRERV